MLPAGSSVLTIAVGPEYYKKLAINLAASIRLWHSADELPIYIVTDFPPPPAPGFPVEFIIIENNSLGIGFRPKLFLDRLVRTHHTLFIDADCLVYSRLDAVFNATETLSVGVVGACVSEGEWFGDVRKYCEHLHVQSIPKFNGGVYSVIKERAGIIYDKARELEQFYDDWGLVRLRNCANDELLISGALASFNVKCVPDDGSILGDFQACPGPFTLDIYSGRRILSNPPKPSHCHCDWYPFSRISPSIVHFLSTHSCSYYYLAEAFKARWAHSIIPRPVISVYSLLFMYFPGYLKSKSKNLLRPLYRVLFGTRAVRNRRS
jgi:hypothetical protein